MDAGFIASMVALPLHLRRTSPWPRGTAAGEGSLDPCAGGKANQTAASENVAALVEGLVVAIDVPQVDPGPHTSESSVPIGERMRRGKRTCRRQVGQRAVPAGAQARRQRQHAQVRGAGRNTCAQRPGQGSLPHHAANGRSEVAKRAAASRRSDGPPAAGSGSQRQAFRIGFVPGRRQLVAHTPARLLRK